MNDAEIQRIADAAAKKAIENVFETMGWDVSTPAGRESARRDAAYIRSSRKTAEKVSVAVRMAFITAVVTGTLTLLWQGLKMALTKDMM